MSNLAVQIPGHVVFGRAHFDDGRQPVNTADLLFVHPTDPHTLGAVGLRLKLAGSPPWMKALNLPGVPFGRAVAATLPRPVVEAVVRGDGGRAFTELEVADFLRPVLDSVTRCERILAGVAAPPSADPIYIPMSPVMLPHWHFIAGDDRAEPKICGAVEYLALRVFTPTEFSFVERHGGRLRKMPAADLVQVNAISTDEQRASEWMRRNVTKYVANQRDVRITDCMSAIGVRKPAARAGWNALDESIKGPSRLPK